MLSIVDIVEQVSNLGLVISCGTVRVYDSDRLIPRGNIVNTGSRAGTRLQYPECTSAELYASKRLLKMRPVHKPQVVAARKIVLECYDKGIMDKVKFSPEYVLATEWKVLRDGALETLARIKGTE